MTSLFKSRSTQIELMDDLSCSGPVVDQTLRELDTINKWLGGNHVTISGIDRLTRNINLQQLKIVDVGCGSGDMLIRIAEWARKKKLEVDLIGVDANPNILDYAHQNSKSYPEISYQAIDILSDTFQSWSYDIVTATLFTHHFTNEQLIDMFTMFNKKSSIGLVINDLHRNRFAYHSIKLLTSLFSNSEMVRFDAPLSVLRAFSKEELKYILQESKVSEYALRWMWAFRWQVVVPSSLAKLS